MELSMNHRLTVSFFKRSTVAVAKSLLGCLLVHEAKGRRTSGRIVEVEAYLPKNDPGCHAARGLTRRNKPMYGPPGRAYVYFCYGNHDLFNVVTEREGVPGAVLVRALQPVEGLSTMIGRRWGIPKIPSRSSRLRGEKVLGGLTNGPGKLTRALDIDRHRHNGADLLNGPLRVESGGLNRGETVGVTTRIGITEGFGLPLRFYIEGHPCLSVKPGRDRPSPGRKKILKGAGGR